MTYTPSPDRYSKSVGYNFCGKKWFTTSTNLIGTVAQLGDVDNSKEAEKMLTYAFDNGITHFDLANNYGVPAGSAEINFGKILKNQFASHRDELIISSKAGHLMWDGTLWRRWLTQIHDGKRGAKSETYGSRLR